MKIESTNYLLVFDSLLQDDRDHDESLLIDFLNSKSEVLERKNVVLMKVPQQKRGSNDCALFCIEYLLMFIQDLPLSSDFKKYSQKSTWFREMRVFTRENLRCLLWQLRLDINPIDIESEPYLSDSSVEIIDVDEAFDVNMISSDTNSE